MPRIDARRALRFVARGLAWLTGGVLLLALAWVLSNLRDIEPAPRPAALALPAPQLRDEANAFFALVGLNAGADRDPAVAGRALWRSRLAFAALPHEQRYLKAAGEAMVRSEREALGSGLPSLAGAPLVCDAKHSNCAAQWIAQADALAAQRQTHATLGARCEQLLDKSFAFEEKLPPFQSAADPLAPHISGAASCSKWLLSGAVMAWTQQRPGVAVVLLTQADRLDRALLAGSHSLIAQMIALRLARQTSNAVVTLAVRDPALASARRRGSGSGGSKLGYVIFGILRSGSYGAKRRKGQNRPILRPPGFPSSEQPPPTLLAGTIDELDGIKLYIS